MPAGADRGGVEIVGLTDFLRDLKKFEPAVSKDFRTRLRKAVAVIAADAQRRAPRKTGKLAKLIKPSVTNKGAALVSRANYGKITEFGGRHQVFGHNDRWVFHAARPHIWPAVHAGRASVEAEAQAALDFATREAGFK